MSADSTLANLISTIRARLCTRSPFFGSLALFAPVEPTDSIPTAATDGRRIYLNPAFFMGLPLVEQEALFLHEVLHAALLHVSRGVGRDWNRWNIAADIVVNGILVKEGYSLAAGSAQDTWLEQFSAEEVYDLLQQPICASKNFDLVHDDLMCSRPEECSFGGEMSPLSQEQKQSLEDYWANVFEQVKITQETANQGSLPAYLKRELGSLKTAKLNWRQYLWRYLVHTPTDFSGFDRRFIGHRLYLDALIGESVQVVVAVDTSGSINDEQVHAFLGEVQGILGAYPHLRCDMYYIDAEAHGPYQLTAYSAIPTPIGGGGTDFRPFFELVTTGYDISAPLVSVYLTDGYGSFPDSTPPFPTLWVVTPGGLDLDSFPFGEVARLSN